MEQSQRNASLTGNKLRIFNQLIDNTVNMDFMQITSTKDPDIGLRPEIIRHWVLVFLGAQLHSDISIDAVFTITG
jgi:hypothetical protein